MRVLVLWHCPYPWDVRIEKFTRAFSDIDLATDLVCRGRDRLPEFENLKQLNIHRVGNKRSLWSKFCSYPFFFNPIWFTSASRVIRQTNPSCLMVRDIPLAMTAIWLGKKFRIPIILDMAENYPAALIAYQNNLYKPFLVADACLPRNYEKTVVRRAHHIIVVAEEQMARLARLGIPEERITIVRNTPDLSGYDARKNPKPTHCLKENYHPSLLYVGKIDRHRGVDVLISALPEILKHYSKAELVLVGDGKEKASLESLVRALELDKHVIFTGWVNHDRVPSYIRTSTICCIPHLKSEHTDTTIPNKLFDYMAFGKPVVASNLSPVKRIIDQVGCGETFVSGNSKDLVRALVRAIRNPILAEMGAKGRVAVLNHFNWDIDASKVKSLLTRIISSSADWSADDVQN